VGWELVFVDFPWRFFDCAHSPERGNERWEEIAMTALLITAAVGFVATGMMALTLYLINWGGFANADMINAVGSFVTKNEADALGTGLLIHFAVGITFAFVYVGAWSAWALPGFQQYLLLGVLSGAFHGLVVSFLLVAVVAEHHPLERFQKAGVGVAAAHWVAHLVYGLVIGIGAGAYLVRFDFIPVLAEWPR
jgi:hypothetical protein